MFHEGRYLKSGKPHHTMIPVVLSDDLPPATPVTTRRIADLSEDEARRLGLDRWHRIKPKGTVKAKLEWELHGPRCSCKRPAVARRVWPQTQYRCAACVDREGLKPTSASGPQVHGF
jgi:hypothetical protein